LSNSPPDPNAPVTLRASSALSLRRPPAQAPGDAAAASVHAAGPETEESRALPALAGGAVAVLLGGAWLLQRRRRLAPQPEVHDEADGASVSPPAAAIPDAVAPVAMPAVVAAAAVAPPVDDEAVFAAQFQDEPVALQPQQSFPAPLEARHRSNSRLSIPSQKRLIKALMWLRTVAGGTAILAAIAIVVFWAIETTDMRAGDTGLTRPLLVLLLSAWALSWASGHLANALHRAFFGRVHPKFDN
jgi:hypothetical protein